MKLCPQGEKNEEKNWQRRGRKRSHLNEGRIVKCNRMWGRERNGEEEGECDDVYKEVERDDDWWGVKHLWAFFAVVLYIAHTIFIYS